MDTFIAYWAVLHYPVMGMECFRESSPAVSERRAVNPNHASIVPLFHCFDDCPVKSIETRRMHH